MYERFNERKEYDQQYKELDKKVYSSLKEWSDNKARMEEEAQRRRESMRYGNRFENRAWRPQTAGIEQT